MNDALVANKPPVKITVKSGLIWFNGKDIDALGADVIAQANGLANAEQFVKLHNGKTLELDEFNKIVEGVKYFFDVEAFNRIRRETLSDKRRIIPHHSIWASQVDHPCLRYNEYAITRWQDQGLVDPELQGIFDKGHIEEEFVIENMKEMGFKVRQAQRPYIESMKKNGKDLKYKLSGKLDVEGMHPEITKGTWVKFEVKGVSPFTYDAIDTIDDMLNHKSYYVRMYPGQLISYLIMAEEDMGVMMLENKLTGALKPIPIPLDYNIGERILAKAETISMVVEQIEKNPGKAEELLSPRIEFDSKICSRCAFGHICLPDANFSGVAIELGEEVIAGLAKREELKPLAAEYETLDKELKGIFIKKGVGKYQTGGTGDIKGFDVEVTRQERKKYDVPEEVKEKYPAEPTVSFVTKIKVAK